MEGGNQGWQLPAGEAVAGPQHPFPGQPVRPRRPGQEGDRQGPGHRPVHRVPGEEMQLRLRGLRAFL